MSTDYVKGFPCTLVWKLDAGWLNAHCFSVHQAVPLFESSGSLFFYWMHHVFAAYATAVCCWHRYFSTLYRVISYHTSRYTVGTYTNVKVILSWVVLLLLLLLYEQVPQRHLEVGPRGKGRQHNRWGRFLMGRAQTFESAFREHRSQLFETRLFIDSYILCQAATSVPEGSI